MKAQVLSRRFCHVFTKDCRVVSAQMDSSDEDCQVRSLSFSKIFAFYWKYSL